jgi:predicted O-methyltransferase YrrM
MRFLRFFARLDAIRRTHHLTDEEDILRFLEPPSYGDIFGPYQKRAEIHSLLSWVKQLSPQNVLEIGTNNGGTLFLWCRAASPTATIISIDLPQGKFGGGYSLRRVPYYKAFASARQRLRLLRADSHHPATLRKVERILEGKPLDFLFIDGDHTYDGVRQDFETYGKLVRPGGLVAFHDIVSADQAIGGEVARFWADLRQRFPVQEFIESPEQAMMGIGLLEVPKRGLLPTP